MRVSPSSPTIRVALADDHALFRSGLSSLLARIPGVDVVGEAEDGTQLLQLLQDRAADVVLVDITMPGMDGLTAITRIRQQHPAVRVIVISMHDDRSLVQLAVDNGASGYLTKDAPEFELETALRSVMVRGSYFSPAVTQHLFRRGDSAGLTPRQLEILILLAQGRSAKEIGFQLGLSPRTVDVHRARLMERLEVRDIASLTRYAVRQGLVKP